MFGNDPDRDWQNWGKTDPYFGVLTDPKFLTANLNDSALAEFFASGERHVEHVCEFIRSRVQPDFQPGRVLDYGCGAGRLVVAFAARSREVVGVDVASSMLEVARANCKRLGADSVNLLHVDKLDSLASASFDLVHSYLVFQHIPVAQGELILRKLILLLAEGGVGAIQLTCVDRRTAVRRGLSSLRRRVGVVHGVMNLAQGRRFSTPLMQMNSYSMSRVFDILIDTDCSNLNVEFWEHRNFRGAMLYFQRLSKPLL